MKRADEVLFIALLAVLATAVGYRFGFGNQLEQLPLIQRLLDPTFLEHDFYVTGASQFGPRYYYAHIIAALARIVPWSRKRLRRLLSLLATSTTRSPGPDPRALPRSPHNPRSGPRSCLTFR